MARRYARRRGTKTNPGTPVRKVRDPYNPLMQYWVDAAGNRTRAPSGSGSKTQLPGVSSATSMSVGSDPSRLLKGETWTGSGKAAVESLTGISENNSGLMNAALAGMAVVPIPGAAKKAIASGVKAATRGVGRTAPRVVPKATTAVVKGTTKKRAPKRTPAKQSPPKQTPSQVQKQRDLAKARMESQNPALKIPARPQPKPKNVKNDAPGAGKSSGNQQPRPVRKPKYKPTKTSTSGKPKQDAVARDTPMSRDEVLATLKKFDFDETAPFGPRNPGKKSGYDGLEKAFQRQKLRETGKRTKGVTKKTPIARERVETQVARKKKAGGSQSIYDAAKDETGRLGGSKAIARATPEELQKALKNPRSSESRLMKTLEKRARRGNLREGEVQVLNRLRDNAPKAVDGRSIPGLMTNNIRKSGQPVGVNAGTINPPRNVKASNQKWREEGGKDAPKGPKGKTGKQKRGDKITENAKEEDGVTRIKGTGGQQRRQVATGQELVPVGRRPGATGRRTGGSSSSGRRPIPMESSRRGTDVVPRRTRSEVVQGEVVRSRPSGGRVRTEPIDMPTRPVGSRSVVKGQRTPKRGASSPWATPLKRTFAMPGRAAAETKKKGMSKKKKVLAGAAITGAAASGFLSGVGQKRKEQAADKPTTPPRKTSDTVRDKYGRKISRAEFNQREAYRKSLQGMSAAEKKKARKAEMKRREQYRSSEATTRFGEQATKKFRNLDLREGVSSRKVNKEMMAARGGGGNRQAANEIRKKYQRKKK